MSASPTVAASSTKRPLEDPSSPAGPNDQPDAKRPALDKMVRDDQSTEALDVAESANAPTEDIKAEDKPDDNTQYDVAFHNGVSNEHTETAGAETPTEANTQLDTQPIQSTSGANSRQMARSQPQDESNWLHLRAVITTSEAATIIGKGGENVSQIRQLSGAKCTLSDYSRGLVERILTVSGHVDAVSKAFGLIVRTLNQEDINNPSTAASKSYPMRLLIPHILIGSIIGKGGQRIREIQEASNAKLNASDSVLPLSQERSLVVLGVADAVHIAVYYVAQTLVEQLTERFGGPAASAYASRNGTAANIVPGGMSVQPYIPMPAGGQYGPSNHHYRPRHDHAAQRTPAPQYGVQYPMHGQAGHMGNVQQNMPYGAASPNRGYAGMGPQAAAPYGAPHAAAPVAHGAAAQPVGLPGQPLTQQIYIPNDMVGAIIGKGGAKINEIRSLSGSVIKINEPTDNSNERLVTITGTTESNQMALYMLYQRLESEKHRM
ncbi:eukaryotic type KH-domain (KH-domain type I) [Sporormia fimetaria CBS 119925]|uniref:Eukaryotic type KH-domain (KH-domain type I) n=1 Tax=Sporormia fimetaria CBS 119925 TaxID=1340428 RepID=A0A6A6UZR2_9PLEO|nr:eukaryotic type KH-domain (KH-domain type I) [Sporormia fimetaria CBS 119925]